MYYIESAVDSNFPNISHQTHPVTKPENFEQYVSMLASKYGILVHSMPSTIRRPKHPALWQLLPWKAITIRRIQIHSVSYNSISLKPTQSSGIWPLTPPIREDGSRVRDTEEDNDRRESDSSIQRCCEYIVIFG
jgi:hypothetical protein